MKIKTAVLVAACVALAGGSARAQYPMEFNYPYPGIQALANQHPYLRGYNPYSPSCAPEQPGEHISHDEAIHGQWSFFVCREGTYDCHLSQHTYIGETKAVYAAAALTKQGYFGINIKPLRLLQHLMQPGIPLAGYNGGPSADERFEAASPQSRDQEPVE
jgi:hypothetical protein